MLANERTAVIGPFEDDRLADVIVEAHGLSGNIPRGETRRRRAGPRRGAGPSRLGRQVQRTENETGDRDDTHDVRIKLSHGAASVRSASSLWCRLCGSNTRPTAY